MEGKTKYQETHHTPPLVLNATSLPSNPSLQTGRFTKLFSNAALHWILGPPSTRASFFRDAALALRPGGVFAFELGGQGCLPEVMAALASCMARRLPAGGGVAAALALSPWFFPDEAWARRTLEEEVGGWRVERAERVWRPTMADRGGIDGWVRLMAARFFEAIPEGEEREACIREVVEVLEAVCRVPGGGYMLSYVRLRVLAVRV